MNHFFITGTDTDCGKTYVTCKLLNHLHLQGINGLGLKPVASGCKIEGGELISADVEAIEQCNPPCEQSINSWRFKEPISPHIAAKNAGQSLSVEAIANFCDNEAFSEFKTVIIEGAGGLMAPLNEQETWLDFLIHSNIPVILVVAMKLGCLNHALLTDHALKNSRIHFAGWVANCLDDKMLELDENIHTLAEKMSAPLLAKIPYQGEPIFFKPFNAYAFS